MPVIVFLLGRPGSGKSRIARCITGEETPPVNDSQNKWPPEGWEAIHITDYQFLLQMFQKHQQAKPVPGKRQFVKSEFGGFGVTDFKVLFQALQEVNNELLLHVNTPQKLIIVEFARDTYADRATIWDAFNADILARSYFIYLQADIEICIQRVRERARHSRWQDDTYVPVDIMHKYYQTDNADDLQKVFSSERIRLINSNGEFATAWKEVQGLIQQLCAEQTKR